MTEVCNVGQVWPEGISDGLLLPCGRCGERQPVIDHIVDDAFWDATVPRELARGVVCLPCLVELSTPAAVAKAIKGVQLTLPGVTIECDARRAHVYLHRRPPTDYDRFKQQHPDLLHEAEMEIAAGEAAAKLAAEREAIRAEARREFAGEIVALMSKGDVNQSGPRAAYRNVAKRLVYPNWNDAERYWCERIERLAATPPQPDPSAADLTDSPSTNPKGATQ